MAVVGSEQSNGSTYRERADEEASALTRFIHRDYTRRFLPFVTHATRQFEYHPPSRAVRSLPRGRLGSTFGGYSFEDTPTLVSKLLLPSEPKKVERNEVVTGWQVDVDAPPSWAARLVYGSLASHRLTLSGVIQTAELDQDEPTPPAFTVMPGLTYPLGWAELNLGQEMPENPEDELYALHAQTLSDIRTSFGDTR